MRTPASLPQKQSSALPYFLLTLAAAALWAMYTASACIARLQHYGTFVADMGTFRLSFQQMAEGLPPIISTIPPYIAQHHLFGMHFSPVLYLLVPFYAIWPHAELLFVAQSLLMASAAPLLFLLGRDRGITPRMAFCFALLALLNPFLLNAALNDFHEISFAVPLMCIGLRAVVRRKFSWLLLACAGLLLTKEHYGASVMGFGLLWTWQHRDWKRGGMLAAGGILSLALVVGIVIPHFNQGGTHPMIELGATNRYGWITLSWQAAEEAIRRLFYSQLSVAFYFMMLLGCVGYFPLLAPVFLLPGLADLLTNTLSSNGIMRLPIYYYSAPLVPVLLFASMAVWSMPAKLPYRYKQLFLALALATSLAFLIPGKLWERPLQWVQAEDRKNQERNMDQLLGACARPLVQPNIFANLASTPHTRPFSLKFSPEADCIALHLDYPRNPKAVTGQGRFLSPYEPLSPIEYADQVREIAQDTSWRIVYWHTPWLFLRKAPLEAALPQEETRREVLQQLRDMHWFFTYFNRHRKHG